MKNQKGITLVSLVVTIIILIILAGISISTLLGEKGIITKAKQAKENIEIAQKKEEEQLNTLYEQLQESNQGGSLEEGSIGDLTNKIQELQAKFNDLQTEYGDFKTIISEAITEKGVETLETDTAVIMAENIRQISSGEEYNTKTYIIGAVGSSSITTNTGAGVIDCRGYTSGNIGASGSSTGRVIKYEWNSSASFAWPSTTTTGITMNIPEETPYLMIQVSVGAVNNQSWAIVTLYK